MADSVIKKVGVGDLKVGMYIHSLGGDWMSHPFLRNRFMLASDSEIEKIIDAGIRECYIDTGKGLDVSDAPSRKEVRARLESELIDMAQRQPAAPVRVPLVEELARAKFIKSEAQQLVTDMMRDARLGKAIELPSVEPVVQNITESIFRNAGALIGMLRIKSKDDYTFLHSVSVCALMVAFCRTMEFDSDTIHQAGLGGLLHDTGKAMISDDILNKPGRLTDAEFEIMKSHPRAGYDILLKTPRIGPIPLDITLHHHERMDGTGYPDRLAGDAIGQLAQMAAIVDVYDAITSNRVYHKGISAAEALRNIYEWSKHHFNPIYVHGFMRCVGIYPVGTLVRLESSRLAVVVEPHESNLLAPTVKAIFSTKSNTYIAPVIIDLAKPVGLGGADRILNHEPAEKWGIEPMRFLDADQAGTRV